MSRLYAIDLGAWSVKVVIAQPGLRGATITHVIERLVPQGEGSADDRAMAVLAGIVSEYHLEHDTPYLGVYGDQVFTHVLEFGFKNLRRVELGKAVGAELEGVVPVDLEDMVYSFEPLPPVGPAQAIEPGAVVRGRIAAPATGMRVLTYSMRKQRAEELIRRAGAVGAEPRALLPAGGAAVRLVERTPVLAAARAAGAVAVVDIGHERTDVIVVRAGKATYSRTIARGGRQVTEAIAREWKLDFYNAEKAKHSDGFVASNAEPATSEAWVKIHNAVVGEVGPMVRDLRQTFTSCRARTGDTVGAVLLVGGGARLRGLAAYVSENLGVPAFVVSPADAAAIAGPRIGPEGGVDSAAMTVALAHDAATGRPMFDLRSGELAFKVDLSFLRAKAIPLAAAALVVIAFAGISAFASLYKLKKVEGVLSERLQRETKEAFKGEPRTASQVLKSREAKPAEVSPLPKMSAYDLLLEINDKLPKKDKVTIDVSQLEIGKEKVTMRGSAKNDEEIASIIGELRSIKCFTDIASGTQDTGPKGERRFQLTITSTCM
jgi:general secretion pathway protein L